MGEEEPPIKLERVDPPQEYEDLHGWFKGLWYATLHLPSGTELMITSEEDAKALELVLAGYVPTGGATGPHVQGGHDGSQEGSH